MKDFGFWILGFGLLLLHNAAAQPFTRVVEGIPVRDANGAAYTHPWLGGLSVPRPQFVDIDADGDPDLFLQERPGALMFFENIGTGERAVFRWHTDVFAGLDVGEWARLADLDGDGDQDVLAEERSSPRIYRNTGTPQQPAFEPAIDELRGSVVTPGGPPRDTLIHSNAQNILALADIDCDDDDDLFLPRQSGRVTFYRNAGLRDDGLPDFRFETDRYQDIEIIGTFGKHAPVNKILHGAVSIAFADVDLDGDLDLFWGDFFSPSLYFLENTGSCAAPTLQRTSEVFPFTDPLMTRGYNAPAFADIDGDGDPDLFAGVLGGAFAGGAFAANTFYFFRNGDGFTLETRQFISSLDAGEESVPALGDLDADGDLDLLVGNKIDPATTQHAQLFYFENDGTPRVPDYRLVTGAFVDVPDGAFNLAPALGDLDADGDLDLLLGGFDGTLAFYRNDGTAAAPAFVAADPGAIGLSEAVADVGQNSMPAFADIDADGDLDLFVGESRGTINFYRNDGTAQQPAFALVDEAFAGINASARSAPAFVDLDVDGDLDLLVGTNRDGLLFYRNDGTAQQPAFVAEEIDLFDVADVTVPEVAAPDFADVDGDGDLDLLVGGLRGGVFLYLSARAPLANDDALGVPSEALTLRPAYPNPFQGATTLGFRLDRAGQVRLAVYDVRGRLVGEALPDAYLPPGEHAVPFDANGLPAGFYFYAVTTDYGARATGTLLRMR